MIVVIWKYIIYISATTEHISRENPTFILIMRIGNNYNKCNSNENLMSITVPHYYEQWKAWCKDTLYKKKNFTPS